MQQLKKNNKGFTIIEVMIVLVIAAVIILIVFLAVPALQRNARNTERKSDVGKALALINEATTNNGGSPPVDICLAPNTTTITVILSGTCSAIPAGSATIGVSNNWTTVSYDDSPATIPTAATAGTLQVYFDATCTNATTLADGTANRQIAAWYQQEPAINQCQAS